VVGANENEARDRLQKAGWSVSVRQVDNAADRGTVVGQSPSGTALPGETITLSISSGQVPPPPAAPGEGDNGDGDSGGGDNGGGDNGDDGGGDDGGGGDN
jgi:beta-lactam-binding protein with PASTA domain